MAWQTPKTNWNSDDYYNFGDLNRVEGNSDAVADVIDYYSGVKPTLTGLVTNRDNTRFEYYDDLNRIENNVIVLKTASYEPPGWITPVTDWASGDPFDYVDANRLEVNLLALYTLVCNIRDYIPYCGTFACGQDSTYFL